MRRRNFAKELERNARQWGDALSQTYEFAFRRRYNLPPTDPRFLNATVEEIVVDFHAHRYWDDPKLREQEIVSDTFEEDVANFERLAAEMNAAKAKAKEAKAEAAAPEPPPPPAAGEDEWETVVDERFGEGS